MLKGKFTKNENYVIYLFTLTLFKIYSLRNVPVFLFVCFWKSMVINTVCLPSFLKYIFMFTEERQTLEQHRDE